VVTLRLHDGGTIPPEGAYAVPPRSPVRLRVWGATPAEQEQAIRKAGQGWGRNSWDFVATERLDGAVCPLDLHDGKSIAAESGYGWAYVVYRSDSA
jgi:hypothetical protein